MYLFKIIQPLNILAITLVILFSSCGSDDPKKEDVPELITQVRLTFQPDDGGNNIVVTATDPDGDGIQDFQLETITLASTTTYQLTIELFNHLAQPIINISTEVEEEGDEHMFFFKWTDSMFSSPTGDGNVYNRADPLNYLDADVNALPIGLLTEWTTSANPSQGKFRIILKHQPGIKSATSTSSTGQTDLDIEFDIVIE